MIRAKLPIIQVVVFVWAIYRGYDSAVEAEHLNKMRLQCVLLCDSVYSEKMLCLLGSCEARVVTDEDTLLVGKAIRMPSPSLLVHYPEPYRNKAYQITGKSP